MSLQALDSRPRPRLDATTPSRTAMRRALLCLAGGRLVETPRGFALVHDGHMVAERTVLALERAGQVTIWRPAGGRIRHVHLTPYGRRVAATILACEAEKIIDARREELTP